MRHYSLRSIQWRKTTQGWSRAFLARQLIVSLDPVNDPDAETQWREEIDRRSREIVEGKVVCRRVDAALRDIRYEGR